MNKYELAVVVSAKLEDEARARRNRESESSYHTFRRQRDRRG